MQTSRAPSLRPGSLAGVFLFLALTATGCADVDTGSEAPADPTSSSAGATLTDDQIARAFFDAVVAGDREAAAVVATDEAVAVFEPFAPDSGLSFNSPEGGVFFISPGAAPYQCTVSGGLVQECLGEPTGEDGLTDEETARAFFDAVVAGDRDGALAVATGQAVEFFEPYEPHPNFTFSGPDENGYFFISPGAAPYQCTVFAGVVDECLDEPIGE